MPHSNVIDISTRRPREVPNAAERYWDEVELSQMARKRERRQAKSLGEASSREVEGRGIAPATGARSITTSPATFRPDWPAVWSVVVLIWALLIVLDEAGVL